MPTSSVPQSAQADRPRRRRARPPGPARRSSWRLTLAVGALAALVAAGCASDSPDGAPSDDASSASTSTSADSTGSTDAADPTDPTDAADPTDSPADVPEGSPGCAGGGEPADGDSVELAWDGVDRSYLLDVPPDVVGGSPVALVVDLHGFGEGAELHRSVSEFAELGRREGFVTVTPQGQGTPPFFDARPGSVDVGFVEAVIDDVEATQCIDPARVFATGYSNGAFVSSVLACDLSDRIAAVAPVAGIRDVPACAPSRPVPVIAFHGTDDEWILFDGGSSAKAAASPAPAEWTGPTDRPGIEALVPGSLDQPIPDVVAAWAERNGCEGDPTDEPASEDTALVTHPCPAGAEVLLYRTDGGGHSWPGSVTSAELEPAVGPTTMTIDATELIWAFFTDHPLPAA